MAKGDLRMEAQQIYLSSNITTRELAEQLHVSPATVARWCQEGNWVSLRQQVEADAQKKAIKTATNKRAQKLEKLIMASNTLEDALIMAASQFAKALEKAEEKGKPGEMADGFRAKNLQSLAAAIQTATNTRFALDGILTEAERQKIAMEKRKIKNEEQRENEKTEGQENIYTMPSELEEMGK